MTWGVLKKARQKIKPYSLPDFEVDAEKGRAVTNDIKASTAWRFNNPTRIRFGPGCRRYLAELIKEQRVLVVTTQRGRAQLEADPLMFDLSAHAQLTWVDSVLSNPGLEETQAEISNLANERIDCVVGFGGGSVIDTAKALAVALAPTTETHDLASIIAAPGEHVAGAILPFHAVPTTSGTGSEVTPFATIWDHSNRKKLSLVDPRFFPQTAFVDPELTFSLPHEPTISTGLDALNQAFESVWNRNRNPVTTLLAARAIELAFEALPRLQEDLNDNEARTAISEASLLAGLCISQTRTAICHSISYPLTAHFGAAHGLACAYTMSAVANICAKDAPRCLAEVSAFTSHGNVSALISALDNVLEKLLLRTRMLRYLPIQNEVLELRSEMIAKGRSENFILPVTDEMLENVILRS